MNKWVMFTEPGRCLNHSCEPNAGMGFDGAHWLYRAFRDIKAGDEITFDYDMMNYVVENLPRCLCGSSECRGQIMGYRTLPTHKKKEYSGYFSPYLQELVDREITSP
jgi:hypothetical protein